jgi:CheY-like chemotaxis protein
VFTLSLPLLAVPAEAPAPAEETSAESAAALQGLQVLLVDDEADAREVAQVALASLGAEVRLAASADEALQALRSDRFDVLVSDIGMPGMDGLAFIRAVRRLPRGALHELPAVALSAFAMESDRQAGLEAGFQAYVAKPISLRRLAQAVQQALVLSSSQSQAATVR